MLVIAQGQWAMLTGLHTAPGDWLMLLASLLWAVYSWMLARPPAHMSGALRPNWGWAAFLQAQVFTGLVWAGLCTGGELAWSSWSGAGHAGLWPHALGGWLALVFIAVGPSILAYRYWGQAVAMVGPTMAAFFGNLTPLFAALWSMLFLGQSPHWYHPAGLALVMAGITVSSWGARRAT